MSILASFVQWKTKLRMVSRQRVASKLVVVRVVSSAREGHGRMGEATGVARIVYRHSRRRPLHIHSDIGRAGGSCKTA